MIRKPVHAHLLNIPEDLYAEMIETAELKKGEVTAFILEAIKEKLEVQPTAVNPKIQESLIAFRKAVVARS